LAKQNGTINGTVTDRPELCSEARVEVRTRKQGRSASLRPIPMVFIGVKPLRTLQYLGGSSESCKEESARAVTVGARVELNSTDGGDCSHNDEVSSEGALL